MWITKRRGELGVNIISCLIKEYNNKEKECNRELAKRMQTQFIMVQQMPLLMLTSLQSREEGAIMLEGLNCTWIACLLQTSTISTQRQDHLPTNLNYYCFQGLQSAIYNG